MTHVLVRTVHPTREPATLPVVLVRPAVAAGAWIARRADETGGDFMVATGAIWSATTTHDACPSCAAAIDDAVAIARCTGSTGATHTDGDHAATVRRGVTS